MKILVTGATGFIGYNLVKALSIRQDEVYCLVRRTSKLEKLMKLPVNFVTSDINDEEDLKRVFKEVSPEVVFHCAATVIEKDRSKLNKANVEGTKNICEACLLSGIKKLIYTSSVSVVSGNTEMPLRDGMDYKASNPYGESKIEAEKTAIGYRAKGLKIAIIRPCMVYGEEEPHALDKILRWVKLRRIPLCALDKMDSKLQLVYIDNVIQVLLLALEKDEAIDGTFIVADRDIITVREFLNTLYAELGVKPFIIPSWIVNTANKIPFFREKIDRFFKDRLYDITRAEEVLGYDPKVPTIEGLKKTVRYWKNKGEDKCQRPDEWLDTGDFV